MRLSWDKKTVLVSDDKFPRTYPMTSSNESKLYAVIAVPIRSLIPTRIGILKALFDGYLGPVFASGQHVENL